MNILFLTISRINGLEERGIYTDLMREFIRNGHAMYIVSPYERRFHQPTGVMENGGARILKVKTLNIQKTNIVEKGGEVDFTVLLEQIVYYQFIGILTDLFSV